MPARVSAPTSTALLLVLAAGCSGAKPGAFVATPDDAGTGGGRGSAADGGSVNGAAGGVPTLTEDAGTVVTLDDASPPAAATVVYAHDETTLYQIDPTDPTLTATSRGSFDCIGASGSSAMTDIAIDDGLNLFGVATSTIFVDMKIAPGGVQCAAGAVPIEAGSISLDDARFYGQSFAPKGTLDPNAEALVVGNDEGEMYVVDQTTGALTIVGTFGVVPPTDGNGNAYPSGDGGGSPGSVFQMSGDIVFLDNGGSPLGFATVRDCASDSTCSKVDTLVELDVAKMALQNTGSVVKAVRGQVRKAANCADANNAAYGSMYGIAAYADKIIGFSHDGFIVSISNVDGTACLIHDYSGTIAFDGAGVTSGAPVIAPPPK